MFSLNCKGKMLTLEKPAVMGIINATPDSFYEGHLSDTKENLLSRVAKMIVDGASIIDIGGQSTRPGSVQINKNEESDRVLPIIELIHKTFPTTIISIDTYYSKVANEAILAGASMVNDISAGKFDEEMIPIVASAKVPYICMHMQGTPENMQKNPVYEDITNDILTFFIQKVEDCKKAGILDIIIDPGFGFGKTIQHNFTLLKNLKVLSILGCPILAGLSRKSLINKTLNIDQSQALNGTTVLNTLAIQNGASLLRVHDVKEAMETIQLFDAYNNAVLN
jgi:dihydropteroate synthase